MSHFCFKSSDWMKFTPMKWYDFENLPNPSFIKYFVLLKFSSRFSRTSSREFSLMYFFISFSIFESTLASLYSLPGLAKHGRLLIVVHEPLRKAWGLQKSPRVLAGTRTFHWRPSSEFVEPLFFTSFIHFMIFSSKKFPFWTFTETRLKATASTRLAWYSIRQSDRRKCEN